SAGVSAGPGAPTPPPPQFPPSVPAQGEAKPRRWLKVTAVIIAMIMVLALVAFFGIRWLAPSSGTVPVDVGSNESAPPSPSSSEDLVQPSQSPREKLNAYTEEGTERAADLEGQWVTQVSAKNVGLEADGKTWPVEEILNGDECRSRRLLQDLDRGRHPERIRGPLGQVCGSDPQPERSLGLLSGRKLLGHGRRHRLQPPGTGSRPMSILGSRSRPLPGQAAG